jgi:hypothetical protein
MIVFSQDRLPSGQELKKTSPEYKARVPSEADKQVYLDVRVV